MIFGIISIVAGIFVFTQSSRLNTLSMLASSLSNAAAAFTITAACLVIAGVLSIIHAIKPNGKYMISACVCHGIITITSFAVPVGDLVLWRYICFVLCVYYAIKALAYYHPNQEEEPIVTTFYDENEANKAPTKTETTEKGSE